MREPDIDTEALHDIAARVLPGSGRPVVERAESGVSTPVYRISRAGTTFYLRLAETAAASLGPEALVHDLLRARGALVPDVVFFEPFNPALQRSAMVTTEIPGRPLGLDHEGVDVTGVLAAAGRDLAVINGIRVEGFGWVRRDQTSDQPLAAEFPTARAFALDDFVTHLAALRAFLPAGEVHDIRRTVDRWHGMLDAGEAVLAHGDFDASHIFHRNGQYTGIIDFGEIRGADPLYDLGHAALHDGDTVPFPLLPQLLDGYREVAPLPADYLLRIRRWSLLIGVRALARQANRPLSAYQTHLCGAIRRALAIMSA